MANQNGFDSDEQEQYYLEIERQRQEQEEYERQQYEMYLDQIQQAEGDKEEADK